VLGAQRREHLSELLGRPAVADVGPEAHQLLPAPLEARRDRRLPRDLQRRELVISRRVAAEEREEEEAIRMLLLGALHRDLVALDHPGGADDRAQPSISYIIAWSIDALEARAGDDRPRLPQRGIHEERPVHVAVQVVLIEAVFQLARCEHQRAVELRLPLLRGRRAREDQRDQCNDDRAH
jgi:hypothetical protein